MNDLHKNLVHGYQCAHKRSYCRRLKCVCTCRNECPEGIGGEVSRSALTEDWKTLFVFKSGWNWEKRLELELRSWN